jgi:hypothetical protein
MEPQFFPKRNSAARAPVYDRRRRWPMNRFVFLLVAGSLLWPIGAGATQQGQSALRSWKTADSCARQAQTAYPDFSAESNVKRDAKLKECLNANGLPPRAPLGQPLSR